MEHPFGRHIPFGPARVELFYQKPFNPFRKMQPCLRDKLRGTRAKCIALHIAALWRLGQGVLPWGYEHIVSTLCIHDVFAMKRAIRNTTSTPRISAGARGQHRCSTRPGGWTKPNNKEKHSVSLHAPVSATFPGGILELRFAYRTCLVYAKASIVNPWMCHRIVSPQQTATYYS